MLNQRTLEYRSSAQGDIHAPHISVGQDIHASYARFSKKGGRIGFNEASLKSGAAFFDHVSTDALLTFQGPKISEGIFFTAAKSTCLGKAIILHEIVVRRRLSLNGFEGLGSINMDGGLVDGDFDARNAVFSDLYLRNAHFTRDILAAKVRITSTDQSFYALDVQVDGEIDLSNASATAWVFLERCKIGHDLSLRGAKVTLAQGYQAIHLYEVSVGGGIFVSKGFDTDGDVVIEGGRAGGNVSAMYAKMGNFMLRYAQVAGSIFWIGVKQPSGSGLYLYRTKAASLQDDLSSWPKAGHLGVAGLRYQTLALTRNPTAKQAAELLQLEDVAQSAEDRISWLKLQDSRDVLTSQPWQDLATFSQNALQSTDIHAGKCAACGAFRSGPGVGTKSGQRESPTPKGWRRYVPRMEYKWLARLRWMLILLGWALTLILAGAIGSRFKS